MRMKIEIYEKVHFNFKSVPFGLIILYNFDYV